MLLESEHSDYKSTIVCIEPDTRNTLLLKENIKINKLENKTEVLEAAVSGEDGEISISLMKVTWIEFLIEKNLSNNLKKVKSVSLNTLFKKYGLIVCEWM